MTATPSTRRRAATTARVVLGAVTLVVAAGAVTAAAVLPTPTISARAQAVTVDPSPGATTLVCPASFLVAGRDATAAETLSVAATFELSARVPNDASLADIPIDQVASGLSRSMTAQPVDDARAATAGAASISLTADDASGLAVATCRPATTEGWLVGIDARTGSAGVLMLTNPGSVTATVQITAYGVAGPAPSAVTVSIPAHSAIARPVAGLTGGDAAPILHVSSTGSPVQASLQSTAVRGLAPAGVDVEDVVMTDAPVQVMAGVRITGSADAPAATTRLLATDVATTATVVARAAGSTSVEAEHTIELVPGIPAEVSLDGLGAGAYDVVVTADAPVVAATWQASGGAKGDDYSWYPAAPALTAASEFAVAGGADATVHLVNPTDAGVSVTLAAGSVERTLELGAGESAAVEVPRGTGSITPTGGSVVAAITYADGRRTASTPVWPADAAGSAVTVVR